MSGPVAIPIDDGGTLYLPADDPRAIAYLRQTSTPPMTPGRSPRSPPASPRQASKGIYTIQPGDTLSAIAKDLLGDAKLFPQLAQLNRIENADVIFVGQHLVVPPISNVMGMGTPSTTAVISSAINLMGASPAPPESAASLALARGFMFVFFEQLPDIGSSSRIIRKVAVVPKNYSFPAPSLGPSFAIPNGYGPFLPRDPHGSVSAVDHVTNLAPNKSPFLSASDRAFASGSIEGTPILIDVAKVKAAGGQVLTVDELVAELSTYATNNPASRAQMEKLMWSISKVEGEVLIRGGVPRGAGAPITSSTHLAQITSAEGLWADFKANKISQIELEQGLNDLGRSYGRMRVVGRVGRVLTIVGVIFTVYDLGQAGNRSYQQGSAKPIGAEVIRQIGGWGGAAAGAKIGAVIGASFGIETGPGAIVTGAVGAMVFGALGYFGADLLADQISPN